MVRLSVLEAAALSGRSPAEIRALIEQGRLAAERVELPGGAQYLVEARTLAGLGQLLSAPLPAEVTWRHLRAALDGLRGALARRLEPDEPVEVVLAEAPAGRPAPVGPDAPTLAELGERVERLLGGLARPDPS